IGNRDDQCFSFQTYWSRDLTNWTTNCNEPGSEHRLFPTFIGVSGVTQHLWNQHQQISKHDRESPVAKNSQSHYLVLHFWPIHCKVKVRIIWFFVALHTA